MPPPEPTGPEAGACPWPEQQRHERANRITVEAYLIARRDGRTPEERARIYEREVARLAAEDPALLPGYERRAEQRMTQVVSSS